MTPRQLLGVLRFAEEDARKERAEGLVLGSLAAQGDGKAIKKQVEKLTKD